MTTYIGILHVLSVAQFGHYTDVESLDLKSLGAHLDYISWLDDKGLILVQSIESTHNVIRFLEVIDITLDED